MLVVVEAHLPQRPPLESGILEAQPDLQVDLAAQPLDESEHTLLVGAVKPVLEKLTLLV